MKKSTVITLVVLAALGLGYLLYKISPQPEPALPAQTFDLSEAKKIDAPVELQGDDHILGSPLAKNTLVAYEDLQCPACRVYKPILESLPTQLKDTKVIFRHFPLLTVHRNAAIAAIAAEAAGAQGKFWEFTNLAYDKQDEWAELGDPRAKLAELAQAVGVANLDQFKSDVENLKYKDRVRRDMLEATGLSVNATPTLYFNGKKIEVDTAEKVKAQVESLYRN